MLDDVFEELNANFASALKDLTRDLAKIRTGRANLSIFEGITVDYYGTATPLNQVGTMKVVDAHLITIQPWEKSMIAPTEKAILTSDLGLNPANDGALIRIPIPKLTGERRQELVRLVKRSAEDHKVVVRNYRRDSNETVKMFQKESEISEDEMHRALKTIQDKTDAAIKGIEAQIEAKEKEILEI